MKRLIIMLTIAMTVPIALFAQINWTEHTIDDSFDAANSVFAIDLDDDGDVDVLGAAVIDDDITWWENDGSENFTEHPIADSFDGARCVFAIDLDDDGDVDVLGAANDADDITWWENDGSENFTEHTIADSFNGASSVFAIDLEPDGDVDVLGAASSADAITWWENDGSENFTEHTIADSFDYARCVYAIDLDSDGDVDVLGAANQGDEIAWWENDGDENFTKHTIADSIDRASCVYAIDMEPDGDIDVLGAATSADNAITWWENDGSENFTKHVIDSTFSVRSAYAIDLDDDEDVDILGAAGSADAIIWWENDGDENFTAHTIAGTFDNAWSVYAIDMEPDGDVDVLGAAYLGDEIAWWESDLAVFVDIGTISIDVPSTLPEDTTLNPHATVTNFGEGSASFDVTCEIDPGAYTSTETVTNLAPADSIQVTFPDGFTFVSGFYTVTVYTQLADDINPANDTLEKVIEATGIAEGGSDTPEVFTFSVPTISRNRINIELALPKATEVSLVVYDAVGRLSETLISKNFSAGTHSIPISLHLPAGVYFYNLKTASGENVIKKFLIVE